MVSSSQGVQQLQEGSQWGEEVLAHPKADYLSASVAQLRLLRPDGDVDGGREREKDSLRDVQADQTYSDDQYSKATALQDSVVELMVWTNKGNCFDEWNLGAVGNREGGREGGSESWHTAKSPNAKQLSVNSSGHEYRPVSKEFKRYCFKGFAPTNPASEPNKARDSGQELS